MDGGSVLWRYNTARYNIEIKWFLQGFGRCKYWVQAAGQRIFLLRTTTYHFCRTTEAMGSGGCHAWASPGPRGFHAWVIPHSKARVWREDTEKLIYLLGGSTLVVHTTVCQLQPLSTTYLITQRVRQTFTGRVNKSSPCWVTMCLWGTRFQPRF